MEDRLSEMRIITDTYSIGAFEASEEHAAIRDCNAQVLIQERGQILPRFVLVHCDDGWAAKQGLVRKVNNEVGYAQARGLRVTCHEEIMQGSLTDRGRTRGCRLVGHTLTD